MAQRYRPLPAAVPRPPRRKLATAFGLFFACWAGMASAQTWNAGTGSWLDALNWTPQQVPLAGAGVVVSNGGVAQLSGVAATPLLGSLSVGLASSGTGQGTVASNGAAMLVSGAINVGAHAFNGSFAEGLLDITGAGAQAAQVNVGIVISASATADASGTMRVGNALALGGGFLQAGQIFNSAAGSSANGELVVGGHGGTAGGLLIVGNVTANNDTQVGNTSVGSVSIGGDLALTSGTTSFIGITGGGTDRNAAGTLINRATGTVTVGGTLTLDGPQNLFLGQTRDGEASGVLNVGALDMAGSQISGLSIGNSGQGQASGQLSAGAGDLRVAGTASVGATSAGTAEGTLLLGSGGQLLGDGSGILRVGSSNAANDAVVQATGRTEADGGVAGFSGFEVGVLNGKVAAGSFASGTLIGGATAPATTTGSINVGSLLNFTGQEAGAGSASGQMTMGNTLVLNGNLLQVGQMFRGGGGSTATGSLAIGGDAGTVGAFLIIGNVTASSAAQLGSTSVGNVDIGGNLALASGISGSIGTTGGATDSNAAGTLVNRATGSLTVGGTLTFGDSNSLSIGRTDGGVASGALNASVVQMALGRLATLNIGSSGLGSATGTVEFDGGTLGVQNLLIGRTVGGSAYGRLALNHTTLEAGRVLAGTGGGVAEVLFSDVSSAVDTDFELFSGLLSLDRSLLDVGNRLAFGVGTELRIGIDGLARGVEFGAIDALSAELDGLLTVDFSDLVLGGSMVFDLLRSGSSDGITGNFSGFSFTGLQAGYSVWNGIELDGVEVYRIRIARNDVPEPTSAALVLLALGLLARSGRLARNRC